MKIPPALFFICFLLVSTLSGAAEEKNTADGVLHTFYGLAIEKAGNTVANVKTSRDVVLGNPIEVNFEGRCRISLLFNSRQPEDFALILTVRELTPGTEDTFGLPVNYTYQLQLNEHLQFSIQTHNGLMLSGDVTLSKVDRIELAT